MTGILGRILRELGTIRMVVISNKKMRLRGIKVKQQVRMKNTSRSING